MPFYTQITQKFSKIICLTLLSILAYLNSQLTYFDQKILNNFQASDKKVEILINKVV